MRRNNMSIIAFAFGALLLCSCSSLKTKHQVQDGQGQAAQPGDVEVVQIPVDPDEPNVLPIDEESKNATAKNDDQTASDDSNDGDDQASNDSAPAPDNSITSQIDETQITLKNYPDIPHHYNRYVQKWLDYFQSNRGSKYMRRYLERSSRYLPTMRKILRENGLPEDLAYITLIESGFVLNSRSHVGAVGFWQFMPSTGRRYGLEVNALIDERKDPIKATYAAVRYFRSLYNVFGNWYFAFAAYNGGENRMFHVLMKHDSRDFWTLAESRKLPKETVNYIPKYLAARMIAKDPERYGFSGLQYDDELQYTEVVASQTVNLKTMAQGLGIDYETLRDLNPQYNSEFAPALNGKSMSLRVPANVADKASIALASSYVTNNRWIASIRTSDYVRYRVRKGDTLHRIARRNRTTIARLRSLNNFGSRSALRVGQYIKVPESDFHQKKMIEELRRSLKTPQTAKREPRSSKANTKSTNHKVAAVQKHKSIVVRRGDTLVGISKKYGISLSKILEANDNLHRKSKLVAGMRLTLPHAE